MNPDTPAVHTTITGQALRDYFMDHVVIHRRKFGEHGGFYRVTKPLHVFKKARCRHPVWCIQENAIVNLIIPVGAIVFADDFVFSSDERRSNPAWRKMRASRAAVHSVASIAEYTERHDAWSDYDRSFKYVPGQKVTPKRSFAREYGQCASGIHFFLNLQDTLSYTL